MEQFLTLLITVVVVYGFIRLCMAPIGLIWKVGVNALAGFLSLWLLNLISGFTGILFPINAVTSIIAGFLGLPGIAVLAVLQMMF